MPGSLHYLQVDTHDIHPQYTGDEAQSASTAGPSMTASGFRSKRRRVLLTGFAIAFIILAPLAGLFVQIFGVHSYEVISGSLLTSASLGPTLAIAHVCSTAASAAIPFVLGLEAYRLARKWLAASQHGGENRPTPLQLGIMMNVLHGASISAVYNGLIYILGFGSSSRLQPVHRPPMMRRAVWLLLFLLLLAYACAGFETWLSVSSEPKLFPQNKPYPGDWPLMSTEVNQTLCDVTHSDGLQAGTFFCGLEYNRGNGVQYIDPEGIRTLTNTSTVNAVVFSDDQTALMVPAASATAADLEYSAVTYGIQTSCESVTMDCIDAATLTTNETLTLACSPSVNFNASRGSFGVLNSTGNQYLRPDLYNSDNPFRMGAVVTSDAFVEEDGTFDNSTGFFTHGKAGSWNVLICNVSIVNATYSYSNGSYRTLSTEIVTDVNMTKRMGAYMWTNYIQTGVSDAVEGTGLLSGDYTATFSLELGRRIIALTASIYERSESLGASLLIPAVGARLELAPLVLLCFTLLVYSITVAVVTVLAAHGLSSEPYADLARNRLIEPLSIIHGAFGEPKPQESWEKSVDELFTVEKEEDRLNVGPMELDNGHVAFGISKRRPGRLGFN